MERLDRLAAIAFGLMAVDVPERRARRQAAHIARHALRLMEREVEWIERGYTFTANGQLRAPATVKTR